MTKQQQESGSFKLHEGFNKECGLKGSKLSGGQKQRIPIARAVLKDAPILILDEATSAVDNDTQQAIQEAVVRVSHNTTTIIIAHRVSEVTKAEQIYVM